MSAPRKRIPQLQERVTTPLPYFPYLVSDWEGLTRDLSLDEEGALMRLVREAWSHPIPCTIGDTDATLQRILGSRWKRYVPLVDRLFTPCVEHPGRRRWEHLYALYVDRLGVHRAAVEKGRKGGRPQNTQVDETSAITPGESPARTSGLAEVRKKGEMEEVKREIDPPAAPARHADEPGLQGREVPGDDAHRCDDPKLGGLCARLVSDTDRGALRSVLQGRPADWQRMWIAEMHGSLDHEPGHVKVAPEQLGCTLRDLIARGIMDEPKPPPLKTLRGFLKRSVSEHDRRVSYNVQPSSRSKLGGRVFATATRALEEP